MKKYIHVTKEDREFMMKVFKVTERTVYNALTFAGGRGDTELARKIRKVAKERGGIEMVTGPWVETFYDHDGYMRQVLPNDAMLEMNKETGDCDVIHKGETVRRYEGARISDIKEIQAWAAAL